MREIDPHLPIDQTAARVVSKVSESEREFHPGYKVTSMVLLPTTQFTGPKKHDLTGRIFGSFIVIGHSLIRPTTTENNTRWVAKCKCGRYQIFTTKAVKKNSKLTMCVECRKTRRAKEYFYKLKK